MAYGIVRPLSQVIFQQSWESGEIPVGRRAANVIVVFKKGKKEEPGSYSHVSLSLVRGKNKKIIPGVTAKQLEDNVVIGPNQHENHLTTLRN